MSPEFKFWLRGFRRKIGLSQEALGSKVGVEHVTIGQWERGSNRPDPQKLIKLAEVARDNHDDQVDVWQLFNWVFDMPLPPSGSNVDQRVERLMRRAEQLTDDELVQWNDYLDFILAARGRKKASDAGEAADTDTGKVGGVDQRGN